jgi:hypothetical protein
MNSSSRTRRWARLVGTAVLGGVLSAGVLAALPAQADTNDSDDPGGDTTTTTDTWSNTLSNTLSPGSGISIWFGDRSNSLTSGRLSNTL